MDISIGKVTSEVVNESVWILKIEYSLTRNVSIRSNIQYSIADISLEEVNMYE